MRILERNLNVAKQKILAIVGPTGVGKTSLSIQLAKRWNTEIISCDSMQVYKKMDIGTAKITQEQQQGIVHHLLDIQDYQDPYNVKVFQEKCRTAIQSIQKQGKLPILCGGTGLYLKAALYDYVFEEEEEDLEYTAYLHSLDNETLYEMLRQQDPQSLEKIHMNNKKRIIRALQMAHNGKNKSQREQEQEHEALYDIYFLGLDVNRDLLHQRINDRVDQMFDQGLVKEVTTLFSDPKTWEYTSFQGIGYKEFKAYFCHEKDLDTVKEEIKTHSRQYAKRQYTWFKHQMPVHWFDREEESAMIESIEAWYES